MSRQDGGKKKPGEKKKTAGKLLYIAAAVVFLAGFGLLAYPTVSDQWNTYRQGRLILEYEEAVGETPEEDFTALWEAAEQYNRAFSTNSIYSDVFSGEGGEEAGDSQALLADTAYGRALNLTGNGVMGYITIPEINLKLPIYHGAAEDVLQKGVGHLPGTALPIGGESRHSVLAAHRGLPSARLFTDIDQLEEGDMFYITVLNETHAYEVDEINPMVDKDDAALLERLLSVKEGEDHVTLFTCTPYGVNSHRLLVRGRRTEYTQGAQAEDKTAAGALTQAVHDYYMLLLIAGLLVTAAAVLVLRMVFGKKGRGPTD